MTIDLQQIDQTCMAALDGETYEEPRFSERCSVQPSTRFATWMVAAFESEQPEPTAMALASLSPSGAPRLRWVLCKGWEADGLRFYTNLQSQKGVQLLNDYRVAAAFHWVGLERQVRVEGRVEALDDPMADAYYETRPRLSRLGAWASRQSQPLSDRDTLQASVDAVEARFEGQQPPRPPHWSGFRIVPDRWEFWQGRPGRLHERITCRRIDGEWREWKLFP